MEHRPQGAPYIRDFTVYLTGFKLAVLWWYKNNTMLLRDIVHQTSRGKSAAAGLTTGLYRDTIYGYPVMSKQQNLINITHGIDVSSHVELEISETHNNVLNVVS